MTVEKVIIRPLSGRARVFPRGPAKRSAAGRQHPDNRPPNLPLIYLQSTITIIFFFFFSLSLSLHRSHPQPSAQPPPALRAAAFQIPSCVYSASNLILPLAVPAELQPILCKFVKKLTFSRILLAKYIYNVYICVVILTLCTTFKL